MRSPFGRFSDPAVVPDNFSHNRMCNRTPRASDGFTLLEILVVLALIGLVMGIALPNLARMSDSYVDRQNWRQLEGELERLPAQAYGESRAILLDTRTAATVLRTLPEGWAASLERPIRVDATGWCSGGSIVVRPSRGEQRRYRLDAPSCRIMAVS